MALRRIMTQEQEHKKKKKNQFFIGIILIFVMLSSIIGFGFVNNAANNGAGDPNEVASESITYNGHEFLSYGGVFWSLASRPETFFQFNPTQVENIEVSGLKLSDSYDGKPLYIYSESEIAQQEIANNLNSQVLRVQKACPNSEISQIAGIGSVKCESEVPVKGCEENFIVIGSVTGDGNGNSIVQKESCVIIKAKKGVEVKGTGYSVVNEGELKFYKAQIPMISNGVHVADYNLYLHEDPRTLEDIYLSNPEVVVTQNIVVATDDDFNCDGDGIIALANFAKLYQTFGAKVFKNDSLQCDRYAPYTHVLFHKADETGIDKPKHNCYVVNVNNCEILRASEKFMIESLANVNRYYNQ